MTGGVDDVVLWIGLALALALIVSGLHDYVRDRTAPLRRFGERFVYEFARPLVRVRPCEPVVEARLRVRPSRRKGTVMLAPRGERPYRTPVNPKKNDESDGERVVRVLEDQRFVAGPLYAQGRWVVVPLHLQVSPKQAGGT